jgi:hypothetical protein
VIFSSRNHIKTTQEIVLFPPVFCPTIGGRFRIDDDLYSLAKNRSKAEMRSVPQQVAYWAKVGRAALDNPDLPIEFVRDTLIAVEEESEPFEFSEE